MNAKENNSFKILMNDKISNVIAGIEITPVDNKFILSLVNDFEEGKWRGEKFQNFIWDNIAETALSYRERQNLVSRPYTGLKEAAKKLRLTDKDKDDRGKGSELAEIVLYGVMKNYYGALPVVPKIFYKQNNQDNPKGSDSVHIVIEENDFSVWFGEAKFYNSIEDVRLGEIVTSVENSLQKDKLKKENSIITSIADIDGLIEKELADKIKAFLSPQESIDLLKPKLHIPILLLYQCDITSKCTLFDDTYIDNVINHQKDRALSYFKKQITKLSGIHLYEQIKFHVILMPVPLKEEIVNEFITTVEHHKR